MIKKIVTIALVGVFFLVPFYTKALSGTNAKKVKVKIYAEQNDVWFRSGTKRTDEKGVIKLKNVLPSWYKFKVADKDIEDNQTLAIEIRMLDNEGRRIKEKTDVDIYVKINGESVYAQTTETDKDGWLKLEGLAPGTKYKLSIDEKDNASLSHKDGKIRIKIKANALSRSSGDWTGWFHSGYFRTDENRILEAINVLPAKYKFSYKTEDSALNIPFILKARMLDEDGAEIKKPTTFLLYYELNDELQPAGTVTSDDDGWVTIPGLLPGMKYKVNIVK